MYKHFICDVTEMDELLEGINEKGNKLMGVTYIGDSQQVLLIIEEGPKSILQSMKEKVGREKVEEEK
jgi:hypothetical protein